MPAYLMLLDGMIETWPGNGRLLMAGAQGYTSFASAFLEEENKEYALEIYGRARKYALKSLETRGLKDPVSIPFDEFSKRVEEPRKERRSVPFLGCDLLGKLDQAQPRLHGSPGRASEG